MTKLISGRVKKIPSANVSASRYEFIKLSETEPDLGLPAGNGYVLASNVNGLRTWIVPVTEQRVANLISTVKANIDLNSINELLDVDTSTVTPVLGYGLVWNGTKWVPNVITVSSTELANVANTVLTIVQGSLIANNAVFAERSNTAVFAERSNIANLVISLGNLTTSNLAEGVNLYYTNARVYSNVIGLLNAKANIVDLTTANVAESASNLYYTNARVHSNIVAALPTYTGNVAAGNVIVGTGSGGSITGANLISANNISAVNWLNLYTANVIETSGNLYYTDNRVYANVTNRLLNLDSNIIPAADEVYNLGSPTRKFKDLYLSGFTINLGNTVLSSSPDNSLSITGLRANTVTANIWNGIYTANVIETDGNLYYTNARVKSALSEGTGVSYNQTTGVIAIGQNVAPNASVSFAGVSIYGPLNVYGNVTTYSSNNLSISDNMIYLNQGSTTSNPDLGITFNYNDGTYHHAGFFRDHTDGRFKVFDNYAPEPDANVYLDTSHPTFRLANIQATTVFAGFVGNLTGFVSRIDNFTTTNLVEGINLYYSNTRANLAIDTRVNKPFIDALGVTAIFASSANVANTVLSISNFTTSNLAEGTNLYYTNARVYANVISLLNTKANVTDLTTANVVESASNLYFTNARVYSNVIALLPTLAGTGISIAANGQISAVTGGTSSAFAERSNIANLVLSLSNLTTSNLSEGTNLYYTNARVYANVLALLPTYTGNLQVGNIITSGGSGRITGAEFISTNTLVTNTIIINGYELFSNNDIVVNRITANVWTNLYTGNIVESTGNLFYSNDRVRSNVIALLPTLAGTGISIAANGRISADVSAAVANITTLTGNISIQGNLSVRDVIYANAISVASAGIPTIASDSNIILAPSDTLIVNNKTTINGNLRVNGFLTSNGLIINGQEIVNGTESVTNINATNVRVNSVVANTLIINGSEFFSNNDITVTRVTANIWTNLYTANVIESASNLYYTNNRVRSNVIALLPTLAGSGISIAANGQISSTASATSVGTLSNLRVTGNITTNVLVTNTIIINGYELFSNNDIVVNRITANVWTNLYTANVIESASNLYFTNARVYSNVLALLPTLAGTGIAIAANGQISSTTAIGSIAGLNTANVTESASNLYYTNARVYANVLALLPTYTGNLQVGNIITSGGTGRITGADLISTNTLVTNTLVINGYELFSNNDIVVNRITANVWTNLYTANVIESAGNVFFTNTRAINAFTPGTGISISGSGVISSTLTGIVTANVVANLTTSNISEGSNLYYTNNRVYANILALLPTLAGNNIVIAANGQISATITTAAPSVFATSIIGLNTANVAESASNLYYTNARVYANVLALLPTYTGNLQVGNIITSGGAGRITGADLISTNTLVTNTIIINGYELFSNNDISVNRITANVWVGLYTANVVESASNLYFTNARVYANVVGILNGKANVTDLTTANVVESASNLYYTNARVYANVIGLLNDKANIVDLTTANVIESVNNLYYTNARVQANTIELLPTLAGSGISIAANGQISATTSAGSVTGLNTANVIESDSNLYYTNARARTAISAGTGVTYDDITGIISIGQNVATHANVTFNEMTITGNLNVLGNLVGFYSNTLIVNDPLIQLGYNNPSDALDLGFIGHYNDGTEKHSGLFRDASDKKYKFFDDYTVEPGAGTINTADSSFRLANVVATTFEGNVVGNVTGFVSSISNFTTSNLDEGNNLYYSNDRVRSNVVTLLPTLAGSGINIAANGQISATTSAGSVTGLNTANVIESASNLYYTNARAILNVIPAVTELLVTSPGLYYSIDQYTGNNPALDVRAGETIAFGLNSPGHPFMIRVSAGGSNYDTGLTHVANDGTISTGSSAQGKVSGRLFWKIPYSLAGNTYVYQCSIHSGMVGSIVIQKSVSTITTSDIAEGANLYYSNVRANLAIDNRVTKTFVENLGVTIGTATFAQVADAANSAIFAQTANIANAVLSISNLSTTNLPEGNNLYYTNARVASNITSFLPTYTGNIQADILYANTLIGTASGGFITGANLISTNIIIASTWTGLYTANVIETPDNLYYTNSRVQSNVIALLPTLAGTGIVIDANGVISASLGGIVTANTIVGLNTSNVSESESNLYYTNARVLSNVTPLLNAKANVVDLTTANVAELTNLYYTNARVYSNIIQLLPEYTGNVKADTVYANAIVGTTSGGFITGANLISTNIIVSSIWTGLYTANVVETPGNLYYTNARVYSNVLALLPTLAGTGIAIDVNGVISASLGGVVTANTVVGLNTANVAEAASNLYYTNARVLSYVTPLLETKANVVDLTTANVAELTNLYYTNSRVYSNVISLLPTYTGNIQADTVYANAIVGTTSGGFITGANLISTNIIIASTWTGLYTSNIIETDNLFFTNARVYANVTQIFANLSTNIVPLVDSVYDLGSPNRRFKDLWLSGSTLRLGNISLSENANGGLEVRSSAGNLAISSDTISANSWVGLYSANVIETPGNLYYTNARVFAALSSGTGILYSNTTGVISIGQNVSPNASVTFANLVITGTATVAGNLIANGLIIRGINVTDTVLAGNVTSGISTSDTITANTITSNVWNNLYTANVIETAGNLYFTNTRVVSALIAGNNITIEANGRISSGEAGATQLTVSSSQQLTGGNQNYTLASPVNNANSIIVSINGLVQAPTTDYTLNGGQGLQFSANTTANALIEVKYYGYSALSPNVAVVSSSVTIPTVAGQAAYMMGANVTQAQSIMVALDGLIQRPTVDYTVNNTTITMIPAPPEGSNIEIRFFGQEAVALAGAQYTTAYISNSRTYAGGSANLDLGSNVLLARNIIVNIDGVTQIPDLNYTVSGNTLSFGTSVPAVGSLVEVKFFGAEAFNANLTQAMVTAVLPTVLSNDTLVRQIIRSSAYAFSRIFY